MWPILLFGLLGLAAPFALTTQSMRRAYVAPMYWWALPLLVILIASLGHVHGLVLTSQAVSHTSAEIKATLAAAGYSTSLFTVAGGGVIAACGLLLGAGFGAAGDVAGGDDPAAAPASPPQTAIVVGVTVLGYAGLFAWMRSLGAEGPARLIALCALLGGLAMAIASWRTGGSEEEAERLAEGRLSVIGCALGATAVAGLVAWSQGEILVFEAMAHASAETKETLIAMGSERVQAAARVSVASIGLVVAAALASAMPVAQHLVKTKALVNLGAGVFSVLVIAGVVLGGYQMAEPGLSYLSTL